MSSKSAYLLAGASSEIERLRVQARAWEPDAEVMLDGIGVERDWRCLDAGCGPMGIIRPLARRAASVTALDNDPLQLSAAREYARSLQLPNVQFVEGDLFNANLPAASFELVHARFVLAPLGRDRQVLDRLASLARNGGVIALQEPDAATWMCIPRSAAWEFLKRLVLTAFHRLGGDLHVGERLGRLLRERGFQALRVRETTMTLAGAHAYSHMLIQMARSLEQRIISSGIAGADELETAIRGCQNALARPGCSVETFRLVQAWARVPR